MAAASAGTLHASPSSSIGSSGAENVSAIQQQKQTHQQLLEQQHHDFQQQLLQSDNHQLLLNQQNLQLHCSKTHQPNQSHHHQPQTSDFQTLPNSYYPKAPHKQPITSISNTPRTQSLIVRPKTNNNNTIQRKPAHNSIAESAGNELNTSPRLVCHSQLLLDQHAKSGLSHHLQFQTTPQNAIKTPNIAPGWQRHSLSGDIIYVR